VLSNLRKISELVESRKEEILKLASDLVKTPSENPPGDHTSIASFVGEYLKKRGLKIKTYAPKEGKISVISEIGVSGKRLLFNGHMDTVPVGDRTRWSFPPLSGEIRNGILYGRGAADMKGGLAAQMAAQALLVNFEKELKGSLVLTAVPDEEIGGELGSKWLVEQGIAKGDACIVAEPSLLRLCRIGEKGVCFVRFTARGVPSHGSLPMKGRNAILIMMKAIEAAKKLYEERVPTPPELKRVISASRKMLVEETRVKESAKAMDRCTLNFGVIQGGTKVNVVPESCTLDIDIRIPPGFSSDQVIKRLEDLLSRNLEEKVEVRAISSTDPTVTSPTEPVVIALQRHATRITQVKPTLFIQPSATDARFFRLSGIPAVSYGPGNGIKYAHAYDEQAPVEQIIQATKIYAAIALECLSC